MLGPAQADPFRAELAGGAGVGRGVGVGAHLHGTDRIRPFHQGGEVTRQLRLEHLDLTLDHLTGRAIDGDDVACLERDAADGQRLRLVVDPDRADAGDAGLAHAASDHRRVAGHAAAGGEDALGRVHAVDVLRRGLDAHEDAAALGLLGGFRGFRVEHDLADGGTGRGRQAGGDDLALGIRVDGRVQELVESARLNALDRLFLRDQALARELDGDAQSRLGGALAVAGLEHPELTALDGELHVLHVAVVFFENPVDAGQFRKALGHRLLHRRLVGLGLDAGLLGDVLRRADARHHVLALGVDKELAVERALAGGGVAGEGDTGGRGVTHVAEHHGLDVDGRAPALGDLVQLAILLGPRNHPGIEHRADRAPELVLRLLREVRAVLVADDLLVDADEMLPVVGLQLGVEVEALLFLVMLQRLLEGVMLHAEDDVRVHRDEAAVGIVGKALVVGVLRHRLDGGVVQAEIEHRIHHARHRGAGAGADGDEQRLVGIAEAAAGERTYLIQGGLYLAGELCRVGLAILVVIGANFRGDGEAGGHREAEVRHLGEVGPLAAKEVAHRRLALGLAVTEGIDPFRHQSLRWTDPAT